MPHDGEHRHNHARKGAARETPEGLSRNETMVWETLAAGEEPLKAYEILDQLKGRGVRAPMTVYRALDGLEGKGHIHKIDGMNAFVLCNHEGPHMVQTFLVCESCSAVEELEMIAVEADIIAAVRKSSFEMKTARLEIRGVCRKCGGD
ncbi:MAG: transcriptional repressor [Pseudomonadota bacterium]